MLAISDIILINYLYSAVCIIIWLSRHSHYLVIPRSVTILNFTLNVNRIIFRIIQYQQQYQQEHGPVYRCMLCIRGLTN